MPGLVSSIVKPTGWSTAVLNHKQGLMTDKRLRQAVQAALDMEPIMAAGFGDKAFYRVDPGLMHLEQPQWHSKAGAEYYNQKNPEKAKKLLKEAGYSGQPVRWITTKEYEYMYKHALVAKQQLEAVGMKIDLQVVDWATLVQRRNKPELFDIFSTGHHVQPRARAEHRGPVQLARAGGVSTTRSSGSTAWRARRIPASARRCGRRSSSSSTRTSGRIKFGDWFALAGASARTCAGT